MNFPIDPHVCLAFPGQETLDDVSLAEMTGRSALGVAGGTPTSNNAGPNATTQSRRVFANTVGDWFSSIENSETTPPSTRLLDSATFECVFEPTNIVGAANDYQTIYMCGFGTDEYLWILYHPVNGNFYVFYNNGSTTQVLTVPYAFTENAWYYVAVRKTVTSGTGTGRMNTFDVWILPLAGATATTWPASPTQTFTALPNPNPNPATAIYHSVGSRQFGGINKPGAMYFAGMIISDIARPTSWLQANFNAFANVTIPITPPPPVVAPTIALVGSATTGSLADIALIWDEAVGAADMAIDQNDIAQDGGLETAVLLSLHCDAYADALTDTLPNLTTDRRGWWGDLFAEVSGDRIGSKLWLLQFVKDIPQVVALAPGIIKEALQWMIDDKVATDVEAIVTSIKDPGSVPNGSVSSWLGMTITITRPNADPANFLFQYNWQSQELRPVDAL